MRTGHPDVMPSAITEAGKTAPHWIEEQVSSHLYCPQSLVIPVLSAVSGHPCAVSQSPVIPVLSAVFRSSLCVRSLWSSL
ncbi:unnamed protein product [Staurois parvus]|uniref:Uncharacterized protein n=1 Tax=Staurois parvus TaxID=386267 RepID=A0ABN9HG86_9NEOB|nr:unnamed protein product [Staurois parvus]